MERIFERFRVESSQARPNQPHRGRLLRNIRARVGWVGLRDYARACYAYKDIWEARTGKQLLCQCENGNRADPFAVVAVKSLLHALPL